MIAALSFRPTRLPLLALLMISSAASAQFGGTQSPLSTYRATDAASGRSPMGSLLPDANDPAEALARYLRTLSDSPNDLGALTGAGHAALAIGDANAALAFYARAEEIAPHDGRIKAGLGSAMLQLEKPKEAIGLFDEATDLGIAETDVASDRGLAWDLRGDARRAQRDYAIALRGNPDDETTRRMALSLAISGDEAGANALLDPLLRRQDRAAWRARAFILAMSGDVAKADVVARSAMSPTQVTALHPFLTRLAGLRPAQKALAVNFGEMPSTGKVYSSGELAAIDGQPSPLRLDSGLIPVGEPWGPRHREDTPIDSETGDDGPLSTAPRRRPGSSDAVAFADRNAASVRSPERKIEPRGAEAAPRPAPLIAAPAADAARPIFFAASAPPVTPPPAAADTPLPALAPSAAPAPAPATLLASASGGPSPSLSALDPAIVERARQEAETAPQAEPRVMAQTEPPPRPVPLDAAEDGPVALPSVGYKLPPAPAKRVPTEEPVARTSAPPIKAPAAKPKPESAKTAPASNADEKSAPPKAKAGAHPEKPSGKTAGGKTSAHDDGDKTGAVEPRDPDEKASPKKIPAKSASGKKEPANKDDDTAATTGRTASTDRNMSAKRDAGQASADDKASAKKRASDQDRKDTKDKDATAKDVEKKASSKKDGVKDDAKSATKPDKAASQRVWVQVAGGATKADLPKAWSKLKGKAPALAKGQSVYTTPLKATNRLLVGPFKSGDEAQAYVNRMGKSGLSGFTFTSDKGQQVDKLATDK